MAHLNSKSSFVVIGSVALALSSLALPGCDGGSASEPDLVAEPESPFSPGLPVDADGGLVTPTADSGTESEPDAGDVLDAGSLAQTDAGTTDAGTIQGLDCQRDMGAADKDRVLLVGHRFSATVGIDGTELRSLSLKVGVGLSDDGMRLDVGVPPANIAFVPSGRFALVLGESGGLVSVAVNGAADLSAVDSVQLPSGSYGELHIRKGGRQAVVVGSNSTDTGGVSVVDIGCDGSLHIDAGAFFPLRLSESLTFLPGSDRAVLLGGQAVFEPIDDDDVRLLNQVESGFEQVGAFDIWGDFIDALRIAVSPSGDTLVMPNGSPFSNEGSQVLIADISGDSITENHRLLNLADAREALYVGDGSTVLVSQFEPGVVAVLRDEGQGLQKVSEVLGVGLAEHMIEIQRGQLAGHIFINSVATVPNIAQLFVEASGSVTDQGDFELGTGSENIPGPIAVTP